MRWRKGEYEIKEGEWWMRWREEWWMRRRKGEWWMDGGRGSGQ